MRRGPRAFVIAIVIIGVSLLGWFGLNWFRSAPTGAPLERPELLPDVWAVASVGDLRGFLESIDAFAKTVGRDQQSILSKGTEFGDADFEGIGEGCGIALIAVDAQTRFIVAEIDESHQSGYQRYCESLGGAARTVEGLFVAALDADSLDAAEGVLPEIRGLLDRRESESRVRVTINMPPIFEYFDSRAQLMIPGLAKMTGATDSRLGQQGFEVACWCAHSIANQTESIEFCGGVDTQGIQFESTIAAKKESNLEKLFGTARDYPAELVSRIPDRMAMRIGGGLDGQSCIALLTDELEKVEARAPHVSEIIRIVQEYYPADLAFEHLAEGMGDSSGINSCVALFDPRDPERARQALFDAMSKHLGLRAAMYDPDEWDPGEVTDLGVVREVGPVAVYEMSTRAALPKDPELRSLMPSSVTREMHAEYAATDSELIWTMGAKRSEWMDQLLTGEPSGSALAAVTRFGTGGCSYGDIDLGMFISLMGSMMPAGVGNPMEDMAAQLDQKPPLQFSIFAKPGLARFALVVPAEVIAAMVSSR